MPFNLASPSPIHGAPLVTSIAIVALLLAGGGDPDRVRYAQLTIRQQVIIRVPTRPVVPVPMKWKEKDGPKCISAGLLAGAQVAKEGIDLILRTGERFRAKSNRSCMALDYYSGFYMRPGIDGLICEDRDTIRVRSGGSCEIDKLKTLVPVMPKQKKR